MNTGTTTMGELVDWLDDLYSLGGSREKAVTVELRVYKEGTRFHLCDLRDQADLEDGLQLKEIKRTVTDVDA